MMGYIDALRVKAETMGTIACLGMDPLLDKIPKKGDVEESIRSFYLDLLDAMEGEDALSPSVKPNIAFYEQYGFEGLRALKDIIKRCHELDLQVILDAKRGDIGRTSTAYANSVFDFWKADAVTIAPYMGSDSVGPFIKRGKDGKGTYVLVRTSNKGARDLQDIDADGIPVYKKCAKALLDWADPGTGAVVGATYPEELEELSKFFVDSGKEIPLLIPGVGQQGGSAKDVLAILDKTGNDRRLHRVNSSSAINYAYMKTDSDDYAGEAAKAMKALKKKCRL